MEFLCNLHSNTKTADDILHVRNCRQCCRDYHKENSTKQLRKKPASFLKNCKSELLIKFNNAVLKNKIPVAKVIELPAFGELGI